MNLEKIVLLGIGFIFLGFILVFVGSIFGAGSKDSKIQTAGGFFIGPFPVFGFGDKKLFYLFWVIAIILFVYFTFFFRKP